MAICVDCAIAADVDRATFNQFKEVTTITKHPTDCGCDCQHAPITEWAEYYLVEEPKNDSNS